MLCQGALGSGDCDHRFLDLRDGIVADLVQVEMRKVGHLVGRHDAIDDRGPVDREGLGDLGVQLARLPRPESMAAASTGERCKIRIGELDALPESRQTYALRLQRDEPKTRIVIDYYLHRQLVVHRRQELAHQHVETAITAKRDDLARAVERLYAVGLTKRSSHSGIVEGTDDPL